MMRLRLITCDMLLRPVEALVTSSPHDVVVSHLSASLHAEPASLRTRLQSEIDRIELDDPHAAAILLGYGLCGGATAGLHARSRPLVLARAHDCATIFLGSRARYRQEHEATPGTYWFTEDNVGHGDALKGWLLGDAERSDGVAETYRGYVESFGTDNADYLMETLGEWQGRYRRGAYLETGLASDGRSADQAHIESQQRGWRFERVMADLTLIDRLLAGMWDEDFLVVGPGEALAMSYDDDVIKAVPEAQIARSPGRTARDL